MLPTPLFSFILKLNNPEGLRHSGLLQFEWIFQFLGAWWVIPHRSYRPHRAQRFCVESGQRPRLLLLLEFLQILISFLHINVRIEPVYRLPIVRISRQIIHPSLLNIAVILLGHNIQLSHYLVVLLFVREYQMFKEFIINSLILFGLKSEDAFEQKRVIPHSKIKEVGQYTHLQKP